MKFVRLWMEIKEEVVTVVRITSPKTQRAFYGPKSVKRVQTNQLTDGSLDILIWLVQHLN